MNVFLSTNAKFHMLTKNDLKLRIICADHDFLYLKMLEQVFQRLSLL